MGECHLKKEASELTQVCREFFQGNIWKGRICSFWGSWELESLNKLPEDLGI
jgi:hypothetical protein